MTLSFPKQALRHIKVLGRWNDDRRILEGVEIDGPTKGKYNESTGQLLLNIPTRDGPIYLSITLDEMDPMQ